MSRSRSVPLAALITAALLAGGAGAAQARTQYYIAVIPASQLQPGQTKGLPVYVDLDLVGKGCPLGPRCFKHATVRRFGTVDWAFPNCTDVLDQASDYNAAVHVKRARPHRFHISGTPDDEPFYRIEANGRFPRHGRIAKGWFEVSDTLSSCTSGRIYFTAHRDTRSQ